MGRSVNGIISVVLGLLGFVGILTSHTGIGILLCIAGAAAAVIALEDHEVRHGSAKAGMASSLMGILVLLVLFVTGNTSQAVEVANATPDQVDSAIDEPVFSKDDISVVLSSITPDKSSTKVRFAVTNKSGEDYSIEALTCSVDGEMVSGELSGTGLVEIPVGETTALTLTVDADSMSEAEVIFRAYQGNTLEWDSGTITIENN